MRKICNVGNSDSLGNGEVVKNVGIVEKWYCRTGRKEDVKEMEMVQVK